MSIAASLPTTFEDSNDELLKLLTDAWDAPLKETVETSKWTRDYLTKLTSLPLDSLLHEPTELEEQQAKAKRDAQQLAFREYPCFLHAQTCRHQVEETLDGLDVHLAEFLASVPELQEACEIFEQHAKEIKEERGKITRVLEHQNDLTDLLEIPQLMETCVWNGYYSEAMDLASHVRLLQVRYPLSIVKSIHQRVKSSSDLMLVQLISHLRKPIRLAAAMNVVGFLRRMDAFDSETELRMVFLRCRHDFLQQRLARLKRDISDEPRQRSADAFEHLKKFIDVMREQMFEIGTQYISIFSNEQGTLLSDYMVHVIELIKTCLDTHLPMIDDTSALASLLTQLQYCGMSLGRIGLDFRHIFVHSFEEAVQPMILQWISNATEDLVQKISKASHESAAPSAWMSSKTVSQNNSNVSSNNRDEAKRHAFQPPMLLLGYPSLAVFINGILSAFNSLRLLPAISLYEPIQNHLEACFLEIGSALKQYCDQAASYMPDEVTYLQSYSAAYVRCCLPFLKSCLVDGIYGNLLTSAATDEDMEALLVTYLPVMKREDEVQILDNTVPDKSSDKNNETNEIVEVQPKSNDAKDIEACQNPKNMTDTNEEPKETDSQKNDDEIKSNAKQKDDLLADKNSDNIQVDDIEEEPVAKGITSTDDEKENDPSNVDVEQLVKEEQATIQKDEKDKKSNTQKARHNSNANSKKKKKSKR
ncbi:Dor1-like family-domain-containing protein [Parasitella parasitica]|nr:Dor1-like family-domain-containing protein [Parasitella parasitica]